MSSRLPVQRPFAQPRMIYRPTEVVSADELEAIHHASLRILAEIGMDFLDPESRDLLAAAGAEVEPGANRVRFDPELVTDLITHVPAGVPAALVEPGPHAHDRRRPPGVRIGRQPAEHRRPRRRAPARATAPRSATCCGCARRSTAVHFVGGYPVEPIDLHCSVRHLEAALDVLTLTDKVLHSYSLGRQRNRDVIEMARIARQVDEATLEREPSVFTRRSTRRRRCASTCRCCRASSSSRRATRSIVMTPFTLSGAMAPITLAGAVAQQNAEALAGMVFTQVVRPGAPVVYGGFTSNVDMQSGAPAFGTPEYVRTAMLGGQLARRYNVPYRSSNVCAANAVDAQAAYESVFSLWGAIMGGVNFLMHGAGWMEGGLHASLAKFVLDADLLAMVAAVPRPDRRRRRHARRSTPSREVGPGGHFFGVAHTQERFRTAFHRPMVSDWRNYETWEEAGSPEAAGRAAQLATRVPRRVRAAADGSRGPRGARRHSSPAASPRAACRRISRARLVVRVSADVSEPSREECDEGERRSSVIGGGVVGASVLYHLTKAGWTDVVLVERKELTAGSTWHSAGGMHTLNGDPNVSKLQQYTIELYRTIEARSGPGLLDPPARRADARRRPRAARLAAHGRRPAGRYLGMDLEIISAAEAKAMFPLLEEQYFVGALFDPVEGHRRSDGVTNAYAICARQAGAEVYRHTWVNDLRQRADGTWDVITDKGEIHAEHIVNAGGLWAREVGRMIGLELPGAGHGAHVPRHRGHGGGRRAQRRDRPRDADGARLRRRDLHPPGGPRDADGHLRAGVRAVVAARGAVELRHGAARRPTSTASPRRWRSRSSTTRRWRRRASSGSSTARSRSHPTATRSSARSAASATAGWRAP